MPTNNPRVNVTFNPNDAEMMKLICNKKNITMSGLVRKVVEDWLEEYEDRILARRAEEAEEKWIKDGSKTYTIEEVCQELGIKLNSPEIPKKTLKNSRRTFRTESLKRSTKDFKSIPKKLENH